jgi:prolyl-tRNA editing enzyme YbaK/EbsC (Cys-tRNA(Pro) deacylase)
MSVQPAVRELLERRRVPYQAFTHRLAYTAQEEAAAAHVPGRDWAKTIICVADEQPILVVLPAPFVINFEKLRALVGARRLRLATEEEMARWYPGYEVGAIPPLGPLYQQPVSSIARSRRKPTWCSTPARTPTAFACRTPRSRPSRSRSWGTTVNCRPAERGQRLTTAVASGCR